MNTRRFTWTVFKAAVVGKSLGIQYVEGVDSYWLTALDGPYTILCTIDKVTPRSADQTDFEDNFKASANQPTWTVVRLRDQAGNAYSPSNPLNTSNVSNSGGIQGAITVGTSAIEVKVGGSALTNRKILTLHNNSNAILYWGYTNAVTTSTGTPLYKDQFVSWSVGPNTSIWVIAGSAGNNGRVTEAA